MNCKPGDLAVYVAAPQCRPENIGRLFNVVRRGDDWRGEVSWWVKPAGTAYSPQCRAFTTREGELLDRFLRPIRDPGEDATDEMVQRVGKPVATPEGVPA